MKAYSFYNDLVHREDFNILLNEKLEAFQKELERVNMDELHRVQGKIELIREFMRIKEQVKR